MHPAPFWIEHVVADDLHRAMFVPEQIRGEGAVADHGCSVFDQRQCNIFAEGRRIASCRDMAEAIGWFAGNWIGYDVTAASNRLIIHRNQTDKGKPVFVLEPLAVN